MPKTLPFTTTDPGLRRFMQFTAEWAMYPDGRLAMTEQIEANPDWGISVKNGRLTYQRCLIRQPDPYEVAHF